MLTTIDQQNALVLTCGRQLTFTAEEEGWLSVWLSTPDHPEQVHVMLTDSELRELRDHITHCISNNPSYSPYIWEIPKQEARAVLVLGRSEAMEFRDMLTKRMEGGEW